MDRKFLDYDGLLHLWEKLKGYFVKAEPGKVLSTNDYTTEEKTKLEGLKNYELPTASADTLGGVKVGAGLAISQGVLSATGGGTADAVEWENVLNKPETFEPSEHTHSASEVTGLSDVATSGQYSDLTGTPKIPTNNNELTNGAGYQTAEDVESAIVAKKYQTAEQVEAAITAKKYQTAEDVEGIVTKKGYQTASDVESAITGKGYQTASDVDDAIEAKGYLDSDEVDAAITAKGYQTSEQVESAITEKGYQTSAQVELAITGKGYQTAADVASAVANADHLKRKIVEQLPEVSGADENTIYMVLLPDAQGNNRYTEWMVVEGKWEKTGDSDVDLTDYIKESDLVSITNQEIDTIIAA